MATLSSLMVPQVVCHSIFGATDENKVGIMTNLGFQCLWICSDLSDTWMISIFSLVPSLRGWWPGARWDRHLLVSSAANSATAALVIGSGMSVVIRSLASPLVSDMVNHLYYLKRIAIQRAESNLENIIYMHIFIISQHWVSPASINLSSWNTGHFLYVVSLIAANDQATKAHSSVKHKSTHSKAHARKWMCIVQNVNRYAQTWTLFPSLAGPDLH